MAVCNMDCLNCIYADCINDVIEDWEEISDEYTGAKPSYYSLHRSEMLEKAKQRKELHPERIRQQGKECYARHRETYRAEKVARNRQRYWDNPEEARRKKREYYHRKKAEREAQLCRA